MLNTSKAFSSFSVNDSQKARNFMAKRWGSNFPAVRKVPWLCPFPEAPKL
jgi:hypothetical protein